MAGWVLVIVAALALNARVVGFSDLSLMDDDINVYLNPHLGGLTAARLKWIFGDWHYVRRYMPPGWLTFSAIFEWGGLDAFYYHAAALVYYLINVGFVFLVIVSGLRVFLPSTQLRGLTQRHIVVSLLAAAWWAFHPMRVESTAWISGLLYGQSMCFFMTGLVAYLRSYIEPHHTMMRRIWLGLAWAGFTASLFIYPLILSLPLLLVILDILYLRTRDRDPLVSFRRLLWEKAIFALPVLAMAFLALYARLSEKEILGAAPSWTNFTVTKRMVQACCVAAYYVWRPWWPFDLSPCYDTLFEFNARFWPFVASVVLVSAVTGLVVIAYRKYPWLTCGWFAHLVMAAPFFGLTESPHYTSDRYAYFLTVIAALAMAAALSAIGNKAIFRVLVGSIAIWVIFLARLSYVQQAIWVDSRSLFAHLVKHLSENEIRENYRGRQLLVDFFEEREQGAIEALTERLRLHPESAGLSKALRIMQVFHSSHITCHTPHALIVPSRLCASYVKACRLDVRIVL